MKSFKARRHSLSSGAHMGSDVHDVDDGRPREMLRGAFHLVRPGSLATNPDFHCGCPVWQRISDASIAVHERDAKVGQVGCIGLPRLLF